LILLGAHLPPPLDEDKNKKELETFYLLQKENFKLRFEVENLESSRSTGTANCLRKTFIFLYFKRSTRENLLQFSYGLVDNFYVLIDSFGSWWNQSGVLTGFTKKLHHERICYCFLPPLFLVAHTKVVCDHFMLHNSYY
jgi:hypothetical protein